MLCSWLWNFNRSARFSCRKQNYCEHVRRPNLEWAVAARDPSDLNATEYLTASAMQCSEDAAALDAAEGKSSAK